MDIEQPDQTDFITRYKISPPIIKAAVKAILDFEENVDPMGYDILYFKEDLPRVVSKAIEPWVGKGTTLFDAMLKEAIGIIACALADCEGWKQEATDFLLKGNNGVSYGQT